VLARDTATAIQYANVVAITHAAARRGLARRVISPQIASLAVTLGRDRDLWDIRCALDRSSGSGRPAVRVLSGLGGVGKTSLARAYARNHQNAYGLVWWVHAEDPTMIDAHARNGFRFGYGRRRSHDALY
jgi:hypothetical protein